MSHHGLLRYSARIHTLKNAVFLLRFSSQQCGKVLSAVEYFPLWNIFLNLPLSRKFIAWQPVTFGMWGSIKINIWNSRSIPSQTYLKAQFEGYINK